MDDLLPVIKGRNITKAIMKIDIEGSEPLAFCEAANLFETIHKPVIFMEVAYFTLRNIVVQRLKAVIKKNFSIRCSPF